MIKKSITTGIMVGLFLTLAGLYPAFTFFVADSLGSAKIWLLELTGSSATSQPLSLTSLIPLLISAAVITLISLTIGSAAAWRVNATTLKQGVTAGVMSGAAAGLTFYLLLILPTLTIWAARILFLIKLVSGEKFPDSLAIAFLRFNLEGLFNYLLPTLLISLVVGGLEGGITSLVRRSLPSTTPAFSLLEAIGKKGGQRAWFAADKDMVLKAGLLVGLVSGVILLIFDLQHASTSMSADPYEAWINSILEQALIGTPLNQVTGDIFVIIFTPLAFLIMLGAGGLAAILPKNPTSRLGARVYAATIAGAITGLLVAIPMVNTLHLSIVLLPQFLTDTFLQHSNLLPEEQALVLTLASIPGRILLIYLLPLIIIGPTMLLGALWGALQGLAYGFILMQLKLRPVDRTRQVRRDIVRRGDQFLPHLYHLFQVDAQALKILEHLAFELKADPAKAQVVAAYHLLATQPERAPEGLNLIVQTLNQQPTWHLRLEISALHRVIAQGWQANTVAQIAAIAPLPEDQTQSLPPILLQVSQRTAGMLNELKKIERVDDLSSKLIFLNNTLDAMRQARMLVREGMTRQDTCRTALPEFSVLRLLLDRWEDIVLTAIKEIQGGAHLTAALKAHRLAFAPNLELSLILTNTGLNVAEQVRLQLDGCQEGYEILNGHQQTIEILSPQDSRELSFVLHPTAQADRLRVCWQLIYNDAQGQDMALDFGDMVEFIQVDKPFQRIFPIPYVTGTPLQSEQMFVGRQDVFNFVREQLLGTSQNNVIVLHGQRRTGKTSILYRLNEVLADTHLSVLIDMQGKAARGEVDFLYAIADDIVYALENQGIMVDLPTRQEFEESPEFFFRSRFLRRITDTLGDKNLLLMFDEFEELQKRVEDGKLAADIFPYLRNLMQHETKVDFIFAGTHKLEELAAEYWSILFNIAVYQKITFLSQEETTRLITQPVAPFGLEYDPLATERIYQVAAGQPYFTQLICHELVTYHNETQRSYLTNLDVDAVLGRIIERGEAHFKYIWAESTTNQRLALLALAELLEAKESATLEDTAALLQKRGRPLGQSDLQPALNNLESRDIVMRSGPRSHLYRFRIDLVRRWIYTTRPAYEKVT